MDDPDSEGVDGRKGYAVVVECVCEGKRLRVSAGLLSRSCSGGS